MTSERTFIHDLEAGTIHDRDIRYVMMRPDVLMGIGAALGDKTAFLNALEESTFANARASFEAYQGLNLLVGDFLGTIANFASRLGWGEWRIVGREADVTHVHVHMSPFAAGIGASDVPACAPITGILRALYLVASQEEVSVRETHCSAQGHEHCRFTIGR